MRIGVVIPAYNRPRLTLESMASVAAQTRAADRVVIVDDCSTDDTAARAQEWIDGRDLAITWSVLRLAKNAGVSSARNDGACSMADCDVLGFLDSDDLWPVDMLERAEATFRTQAGAAAVIADRSVEDSLRDRPARRERYEALARDPVEWMIRYGCPTPSSVLVRRNAFDAVGGYDATMPYHEDLACFMRIARIGSFVHMPGEPIRYRLGLANKLGEDGAATQRFRDRGLRRARVIDAFHEEDPRGVPGRLRAFGWFRAARSAYRHGMWRESRERAARALRCAPWNLRAAWIWTRATVRQMRERARPHVSS